MKKIFNILILFVVIMSFIVFMNMRSNIINEEKYDNVDEILTKNPRFREQVQEDLMFDDIVEQTKDEIRQKNNSIGDFPTREDDLKYHEDLHLEDELEDDVDDSSIEELPLESLMKEIADYNKRLHLGMLAGFIVFIISLVTGILNNIKLILEIGNLIKKKTKA